MANLKEVRIRITSVNSTKQITNAMRMVSASKLRRAQNAIQNFRPYANKLHDLLDNVSRDASAQTVFHAVRPLKKVKLIILASNKGLCGTFNANIIKAGNKRIAELVNENPSVQIELITIGKRITDYYKRTQHTLASVDPGLSEDPNFENISLFVEELMFQFVNEKVDKIECIYNQFKNAATQLIQTEVLLPIEKKETEEDSHVSVDYIFEPDKAGLIQLLMPQVIKSQMYKVFLDSSASEHGARMTSMHKATDNANELLKSLKLSYNKARQSSITNEIIEIIGGSEALNN